MILVIGLHVVHHSKSYINDASGIACALYALTAYWLRLGCVAEVNGSGKAQGKTHIGF